MEIRIKREKGSETNGNADASDVTNIYRVMDNGREFFIAVRSHAHGTVLGIAGQKGVLYTDRDNNVVYRHALAVGDGCGVRVESDALVEGLSAWSIRGVILADQCGETREIRLTAGLPESRHNLPVVLIDGEII